MNKLTILNLEGNTITEIPDSLFKLKSLIELHLSRNNIKEVIIHKFENMKSLKIVDLSHNNIS